MSVSIRVCVLPAPVPFPLTRAFQPILAWPREAGKQRGENGQATGKHWASKAFSGQAELFGIFRVTDSDTCTTMESLAQGNGKYGFTIPGWHNPCGQAPPGEFSF